MTTENDFKLLNNYRVIDADDDNPSDTCQNCVFHIYLKLNKSNEVYCDEGKLNVSVNGICNKYVPLI